MPNNHVLYNLLSWVTTGAVGRFEASYRIWSVVPGVAAVALAAWWAWKRIGPIAAHRGRRARDRLARAPRAHAASAGLRARDVRRAS